MYYQLTLRGRYPGIKEGVTLGSDCVGIVVSDGPLKGKRVCCDPSIGWGSKREAPTGKLEILGMPKDGTFATYMSIPKECVRLAPEYLSDAEVAAFPLAGVTAYRAVVTKGECKRGDRVLVTGVGGGVAVFAVQIAVALGAEVYVTSSSQAKIDRACKELGCKSGVLYTGTDWTANLLKATNGKKMNCIIDGAGGDLSVLMRLTDGGCRVVSYGSTAGSQSQLILPQLFLNNVELRGTAMGSPHDFDGLLRLMNETKLKPVVDETFDFKDFPKALAKMQRGGQFGKLVLMHGDVAQSKL